jgi:hypothetical protein
VLHIVADIWVDDLSDIAGLGTSTILVYLAITWAVQGYVGFIGCRSTGYHASAGLPPATEFPVLQQPVEMPAIVGAAELGRAHPLVGIFDLKYGLAGLDVSL